MVVGMMWHDKTGNENAWNSVCGGWLDDSCIGSDKVSSITTSTTTDREEEEEEDIGRRSTTFKFK